MIRAGALLLAIAPTETGERERRAFMSFMVASSTVGAVWASLWFQWFFPVEDDIVFLFPIAFILVGLMLGAGLTAERPALTKVALITATLVALPSAAILMSLPALGLSLILIWLPGTGAFFLARSLKRRSNGAWWRVVSFSILPWVVALSLFALPPLSGHKWCWPWLGFRSELGDFHQRALQAGSDLGLPRNQLLTIEQRERLSQRVPLAVTLHYPFIGKTIRARIDKLDDTVTLSWGPGQFGPLVVRRMDILSASD